MCMNPDSIVASLESGAKEAAATISPPSTNKDKFSKVGFGLVLALLLGGLALNLTPCVYPMMAITVSFFGGKTSSFMERLLQSTFYVFGVMASFSALGVFAAFSGNLFGSFLQSPTAQLLIVAVFVALALSSFGLYEIGIPFGILGKATSASNFGGIAGAVSKGLFAGLLAAPCIGPFVLALLVFVSEKGSIFTGLWMFSILAFGMGIPYIILGTFTGLLKTMPKSGEWLVDVKKMMGVVLLLLALYYARGFIDPKMYQGIFGLLVLYIGIYLNPFTPKPKLGKGMDSAIRTGAALLLLFGAGTLFKVFIGSGSNIEKATMEMKGVQLGWNPLKESDLKGTADKLTVIDFQSKVWCAACREMDEKTFAAPEVQEMLANSQLVTVDVDKHPQAESLQKRFGIRGIPTLLVLDPKGRELDRIVGYTPPEEFMAKFQSLQSGIGKLAAYPTDDPQ